MTDEQNRLLTLLTAYGKQARNALRIRWSGRILLGSSLLCLGLLALRVIVRARLDLDVGHIPPLLLVAFAAMFVLLALGALEIIIRLAGPNRLAVARTIDRRKKLRDLVIAGLTATRLEGAVPREVARRAVVSVEELPKEKLFPVRRSFAKLLTILPLLLITFYLLGLPPGAGPIALLTAGGTHGGAESPGESPDEPIRPGAEGEAEAGAESEPDAEPEPEPEPEKPDEVVAKIIPAKRKYRAGEPILMFVLAHPGRKMDDAHEMSISLALDGDVAPTEYKVTVEPGEGRKAVVTIDDARTIEKLKDKLTAGKHRIAAVLTGDGIVAVSAEEEFEIENDEKGDGQSPPPPPPKPEPKPEPEGGGEPPPPPMVVKDRLVDPLFDEGDTVKKKGIALVPDPEAPAGTPPRRLNLDDAAAAAGKRGDTGVPTERVLAKDRDVVTRYFELLKDAESKK